MKHIKRWVKKNQVVAICIGVLIVLLLIMMTILTNLTLKNSRIDRVEVKTNNSLVTIETEESSQVEEEEITKMYVDIKGAISAPGMYEVTSDMRVLNVIDLAGGFLEKADTNQINNAAKLEDQMVIYVPMMGEKVDEITVATGETSKSENTESDKGLVNINTDSKESLMQLNGVGEKKAETIIEYREENGSFKSIEELKKVTGIGEKTYESLKESISI